MTTHEDAEKVTDSADSTSPPSPVVAEKDVVGTHVETIHTNERVPGHPAYYEKNGLRTYGDDEDHDHEPPVCFFAVSNLASIIIDLLRVCR
jgi:hypothetical protein